MIYSADYFISKLQLKPHQEGGYFRRIYQNDYKFVRDKNVGKEHICSAIYYLLDAQQSSLFHQLNSDEIWFYHYGSPLIIHIINKEGIIQSYKLGLNILQKEKPQILIPANSIFAAEVEDKSAFTLVSCVVSPEFNYQQFKLFTLNEMQKKFPQYSTIFEKIYKK